MKKLPVLLCAFLIFASCRQETIESSLKYDNVLKDDIDSVIRDYIKLNDSLDINRKIILLEANGIDKDTVSYLLKTINSKYGFNKLPDDFVVMNNSHILISNNRSYVYNLDSSHLNSVRSLINTNIDTHYYPLCYNPIVWEIKSIGEILSVNKYFNEVEIKDVEKFVPPQ